MRHSDGLLELWCDSDSEFARLGDSFRFVSCRVIVIDNLYWKKVVRKALESIIACARVRVWALLTRISWCIWQHVNAKKLGPKYRAGLAYRRRRSLRLARVTASVVEAAVRRGGSAHFEWPRHCPGRRRRSIRAILSLVNMYLADFGICTFGVAASFGVLAFKPSRAATIAKSLAEALTP